MDPMKVKHACLLLVACLSASCDKSKTTAKAGSISSNTNQVESRDEVPTNRETPAQGAITPSADIPTGTARADASSAPPTPEQMIANFKSDGIAGIPKDVADTILAKSSSAATPEEQVRFITEQSAAWQHIEQFKDSTNGMPDHMRRMLIERLSTKHGDSWKNMANELDEQVAASTKVSELRLKGIPGMTPEETNDLIIGAMEQHGPDYKTILSIAEQSIRK